MCWVYIWNTKDCSKDSILIQTLKVNFWLLNVIILFDPLLLAFWFYIRSRILVIFSKRGTLLGSMKDSSRKCHHIYYLNGIHIFGCFLPTNKTASKNDTHSWDIELDFHLDFRNRNGHQDVWCWFQNILSNWVQLFRLCCCHAEVSINLILKRLKA